MQDRILEIVVYLMSQISDQQGNLGSLDEMSADLKSMGFTENEISSAYNWILKHFEDYPDSFAENAREAGKRSFRILSDQEREIISPIAFGYLLQLRYLGLMTTEQMEMIIDRCTLFDAEPIDIEDIKLLASATMFESGLNDMPYGVWIGDPEDEPVN